MAKAAAKYAYNFCSMDETKQTMSKLFRPEAIQHATRRLGGDVVLISPLSVWLLGGLLVSILIGGAVVASQGKPHSAASAP